MKISQYCFAVGACVLVHVTASAHAGAAVVDIAAIINAAQEVPTPTGVPASAGGFGRVQFDDVTKELSWNIAWQDLTGDPVGMHFHAPASRGSNAGVVVNIGNISGLVSPSIGATVVDDVFAEQLLSGQSYINIHTAQNGSGEIRGQADPGNALFSTTLGTQQASPPPTGVPAGAGGTAFVAYDPISSTLGWNIQWSDLSGPATAMHFHGPAAVGENAPVQLDIGGTSGLTSPSIGSAVISSEFASELLSGLWYINIHTEQNPAGEIRGQVVPEPSSAFLAACAAIGMAGVVRRRRGDGVSRSGTT